MAAPKKIKPAKKPVANGSRKTSGLPAPTNKGLGKISPKNL